MGLVGVVVSTLLFLLVLAMRELGLLLLLIVIPVAIFLNRRFTREFLAKSSSCFRVAIAFGIRYLIIGAGLALLLKLIVGGEISDTPFLIFCGSATGTLTGSVAGAFQGWIISQRKFEAGK